VVLHYHLVTRTAMAFFLLAHLTGHVNCGEATALLLLHPPGNRGRSSSIPARPSGAAPDGLDTAGFLRQHAQMGRSVAHIAHQCV
jgi:hypothetical protein